MTAERISPPLIACQECGLVVEATALDEGQKLLCPRCRHRLTFRVLQPSQRVVAYSVSCLMMLILSISFPFMSFSVKGLSQEITLFHAVEMLDQFKYFLIAFVLLATVLILPAIYISLILYLYLKAGSASSHLCSERQRRRIRLLCRVLFRVEPWLMVDVFLIGVLVSLVKISSLADIGLGSSFWAFCVYSVLVVKCVSLIDRFWLWNQFIPPQPVEGVKAGDTHLDGNHTSCHVCHQINPESAGKHTGCIRCGSLLHPYHPELNLQRSWALLVTSVSFLYSGQPVSDDEYRQFWFQYPDDNSGRDSVTVGYGLLSGCCGDFYRQYVHSAGKNVYLGVVIPVGKKSAVVTGQRRHATYKNLPDD